MTSPIITVDGISKAYRIGLAEDKYPTFREALMGMVKAPFRRFQKLRERTSGDDIFWALKDVSFEVQQGEVLGIIGRNGAGKSTLLKILSRITEPTAGTARLRGRVASLLEVGTGFHSELTGRENIFLNGAILGMRKAEIDSKFDEIVDFSGVEKFIDTPVKRYSSGMYVRLAFAVAAHLEPEILIVDEVLAVGDAAFQKKCLGKMGDVAQGGRTVLFVSHNMHAIRALCNRCILIVAGMIQADCPPEEAVASYLADETSTGTLVYVPDQASQSSGPVELLGARLSVNGKPGSGVTNGDKLVFEARVQIRKPCELSVCMPVYRAGELAFLANVYHQKERFNFRQPGAKTFRFHIPSYLLNPGVYTIGLYVGDSRGVHAHYLHYEKLICFTVEDDGVRRGDLFAGHWPGPVSPLLDVDSEPSDEEPEWLKVARQSRQLASSDVRSS